MPNITETMPTVMCRTGRARSTPFECPAGLTWCRQERLPHSESPRPVPVVVVEDKGRWFALSMSPVTAESGDQGTGSIAARDMA